MNKILDMWEKDAVIDQTEPSRELLKIPTLHNKYLSILMRHRQASKDISFNFLMMKKIKWEYYNGKMSKEQLKEHGWEPFGFTLKSDVTTYMEADSDLIQLTKQKIAHDEIIFAIESIMKELNARTFQLRDYIAYEKFINGA